MTWLKRLRDALEPVHESSHMPPREHVIRVDRRDLAALLMDYDAQFIALTDAADARERYERECS